jgi:uncharacterized integral membrane protein
MFKKLLKLALRDKTKTFLFSCIVIFLFLLLLILFALKNIESHSSYTERRHTIPARRW